MPATDNQQVRPGGQLPTVLFWSGVTLAPVAAAVVLLSDGSGALRVAAVLAILTVVLIALSIMLRPDARAIRVELEEKLLDEIDALRADVRQDIATAARATHRAYSEKLQSLYESVEALRAQVEALRTGSARAESYEPAAPAAQPAPPSRGPSVGTAMVGGGVVRHTETVQVTTRQTIVDPHADHDRGAGYGAGSGGTVYGGHAASGHAASGHAASAHAATGHAATGHAATGRAVATGRATATGRAVAGSRADEPAAPREESWTEQRLRERLAEVRAGEPRRDDYRHDDVRRDDYGRDDFAGGEPRRDYPGGEPRRDYAGGEPRWDFGGEPRRSRPFERDEERLVETTGDVRWSGARAGDRWASVRSDERGHELRMGERRAAVRTDDSGTELRIEDRWAEVRQDDGRRDDARWDEGRWDDGRRDDRRRAAGTHRHAGYSEEPAWSRSGALPALPATGPEPAATWTESWREEPERQREPRRRRAEERDDRWGEPGPVNPRPRRTYEMSEDRWR